MIRTVEQTKIEYGDFQTPLELAEKVCKKLVEMGVNPDVIVEPTCGVGNFIKAAAHSFPSTSKILGIEINPAYIQEITDQDIWPKENLKIEIKQADFFKFDWGSKLEKLAGNMMVIGNLPWVTSSQQGNFEGKNLPTKTNFQKHSGLEAITGKSNFDISEWMLIQAVHWLQKREGYLAMLCKISVARKLLNYIHSQKLNLAYCATYNIDAKKYFQANVEACLLFCKFDSQSQNYFCDVFGTLETSKYYRIGYRNKILVKDLQAFEKLSHLDDEQAGAKWRSGIKHDCSKVMELGKIDNNSFVNGFGEKVEIEETYIFPLMKGSDVAQKFDLRPTRKKNQAVQRYVLVPQTFVGQPTEPIKNIAPQTWQYLEAHANQLDKRKSKIYQKNPRFSVFGVGDYTFAPWKIAICGLYKNLNFKLIGPINNKPVVFDDTVYFLGFNNKEKAENFFEIFRSAEVTNFYESLIFWDEKRPIKSSILNRLNLAKLLEAQI